MKEFVKHNFSALLIVALAIVVYFLGKAYLQEEVRRDAEVRELIGNMKEEMKIDSILSAQNRILLDSITKREDELLNQLEYIKQQNNAISKRNKELLDSYNAIGIDRPDF